jgi:hypothetical protein
MCPVVLRHAALFVAECKVRRQTRLRVYASTRDITRITDDSHVENSLLRE